MNKKSIFEHSNLENLKREIRIQKKLYHPHILKLYNFFEDKENVYLILEYCENGTLFEYINKKKKLTEKEAFVYFFQTCLGIDYLHKKEIIHRDLKVFLISNNQKIIIHLIILIYNSKKYNLLFNLKRII